MPEARKHEPSEHAFTGKAVPDPANPRPLLRITGYRGASSEAGHVRLYLDAEISSYIDIPEADVVYQLATPAEADPLGAVTLWVKRDAKLSFKTTQQGGAQAMYGYPGAQAATQTITPGVTPGTQTFTFPPSPIPPFCTPPSPIPLHCTVSPIPVHCTVSPIPWHCPSPIPVHCTVSPIPIHCTVSPLPAFCVSPIPLHCTVTPATPVSPLCTPVSPETPVTPVSPATTPATTPAPFAGAAAFGAAPQAAFGAAPQAITQTHLTVPISQLPQVCHSYPGLCISLYPLQCPTHFPTCPPSWLCSVLPGGCPPSPFPAFCPSPHQILCQTPVASPNCTPTIQPTLTQTTATTQTSPATTPAPFAGAAAFGAAPQAAFGAAPQAITQTQLTIPFSPLCHSIFVVCLPTPLPWQCPSPHPVFCPPTPLCSPLPVCLTIVASPNCTPTIQPTLTQTTATTQTLTQTTATTQTTPATTFAGGPAGMAAAPQGLTVTIRPTYTWPTYPTWTWPTRPTWPTYPTWPTVTHTSFPPM